MHTQRIEKGNRGSGSRCKNVINPLAEMRPRKAGSIRGNPALAISLPRARRCARRACIFALLLCIILLYTDAAYASGTASTARIAAQAYALIDTQSGRVLAAGNGDARLPMASTTKVMTALVVLSNATLTDIVEIDRNASGIEGSSMYLEVGEKQSVENLLLGLMLRSGNDAAVALAQHVGGTLDGFVDMMNEKAREMGLENTLFQNPHGLPADNHYTSALDLCAIMALALENDDFVRIIGTRRAQVAWDGHPWDRVMTNKNQLLDTLEGCIGGKTGYIKASGRCLVEAAERGGMRVVGVVLNCPDWWNQMSKLIEYGYNQYGAHDFIEQGEVVHMANTGGRPAQVDIVAERSMVLPVLESEDLVLRMEIPSMPKPPYGAGAPVGTAWAVIDGVEISSVRLVTAQAVESDDYGDALSRIMGLWLGG